MVANGMRRVVAALAMLGLALSACADGGDAPGPSPSPTGERPATTEPSPAPAAEFIVTSSAFADGEPIPAEYSCQGRNEPPPLEWDGVPDGTKSLALVVDDPDAVGGRYVHWVITGIPPSATGIADGGAPEGATVSANSGDKAAYLGPCPPAGTGVHHYRFRLFALDESVKADAGTPASDVEATIGATAIDEARLVGTYSG